MLNERERQRGKESEVQEWSWSVKVEVDAKSEISRLEMTVSACFGLHFSISVIQNQHRGGINNNIFLD